MPEQALQFNKPVTYNVDGVAFTAASVTDQRMDKTRGSQFFLVATPLCRPGIPVEARPIEVVLREFCSSPVEVDGGLHHVLNNTVVAKTVVSSPNIQNALIRGAGEFGKRFPTQNGG